MAAKVSRRPRLATTFCLTFPFSLTELTMRTYSCTVPLEGEILTDRTNTLLSIQFTPDCQHGICFNVPRHGLRSVGYIDEQDRPHVIHLGEVAVKTRCVGTPSFVVR